MASMQAFKIGILGFAATGAPRGAVVGSGFRV